MKKNFLNNKLRRTVARISFKKIASYDIETDTSDNYNNFLFGGFIRSDGVYKCFKDKDKMIKYMEKHVDKDTWVFATNNSFDHYALFGHRDDFLKEPPLMRGGLLINAKYHNIDTYDTRSYSKATVHQLGVMLNLPKGKTDFKKYNKDIFKSKKIFRNAREYNKRDCTITREFIIGFQKVINELGGNLKCTIGSCAMDLFKRKYLKEDIQHEYNKTFSDGMSLKEFLSKSYHGGRTEIFRRARVNHALDKTKTFYYYDFNSLYPSCMLEDFPQPSSCSLTYHKYGKLHISSILHFEGCSDVEVISPYMEYPILPLVINKKLCFPCGKFRDVFTHLELREFLKNGGKILKCYRTACYTKTFKPFTLWVNELYALRIKYSSEFNQVYKEIIKLLLNNLYGKFFQRNIMNMEFISLKDRNDDDLKQDGFTFDKNIGFGYRETPKECNQTFIIPIIAIYVTAYARLKLWNKLNQLNGIYCDTDSILTDVEIKTSNNLGDVKLEFECNDIQPVKPKEYRLFDKTNGKMIYKTKGVRLGEDRQGDFDKVVSGKPILQRRFGTIKEAIRSQGKFKPNEVRFYNKKFSSEDNKRCWINEFDSDGLEISKPMILGYNFDELNEYFS
jgi:hypothetical protein